MRNEHEPTLPLLDEVSDSTQNETHGELVIAFTAAVGVELEQAEKAAEAKLATLGYRVVRIRVTKDVLPLLDRRANKHFAKQFDRFSTMMDVGNEARQRHGHSVIALGIASAIFKYRASNSSRTSKIAYFVHSLKHPEEVRHLRELYPRGFYLIGVHTSPESRRQHLINSRDMSLSEANKLMDRDKKEGTKHGQRLADTYHLSDFFLGLRYGANESESKQLRQFLENNIGRFVEIMFGHPNRTPTFGEYAMFLAFSASLRSADLSRQVGAVITKHREILGTGANDCPRPQGGQYWPMLNRESLLFEDAPKGRDWTRGADSNRKELLKLRWNILKKAGVEFSETLRVGVWRKSLNQSTTDNFESASGELERALLGALDRVLGLSPIVDLTEFGRVVHAEMEALLSCARKGVSTVGSTLFSTTFPCHNCAKHIVAAGVDKVVFIEPYLKSKALDLHSDAIEIAYTNPLVPPSIERPNKVQFEPFVGVGPRRFFDLFSMNIGVGLEMERKDDSTGVAKDWDPSSARIRIDMRPDSYLERERIAAGKFAKTVDDC